MTPEKEAAARLTGEALRWVVFHAALPLVGHTAVCAPSAFMAARLMGLSGPKVKAFRGVYTPTNPEEIDTRRLVRQHPLKLFRVNFGKERVGPIEPTPYQSRQRAQEAAQRLVGTRQGPLRKVVLTLWCSASVSLPKHNSQLVMEAEQGDHYMDVTEELVQDPEADSDFVYQAKEFFNPEPE